MESICRISERFNY